MRESWCSSKTCQREMKRLSFILFVLASLSSTSCTGDENPSSVEISKYYLSVSPSIELLGDGESKELSISSNCAWTVSKSSSSDWLTVYPQSGSNMGYTTITAGKNNGEERIAVLTVEGGGKKVMVTVTQLKATNGENPQQTTPKENDNNPPLTSKSN